MDVASLQIRVDTSGIAQAESALARLERIGGRVERSTTDLEHSYRRLSPRLTSASTDSNRASQSLTRLDRSSERVGASTNSLAESFKKLSLPFTATASALAAASVLMIRHSAASAKEMQNLARVSNTGIESFQEYAYATQQVGVSSENFADINKDLQDKLGDFVATGGGEFADFFTNVAPKVGLTARQLQKLSGPEALIAVKKALDDANVSASGQVFYLESIANDASLLTPLLKNNGAAFKKQAEEAKKLGAVLSSIESQKLIEAAEASKQFDSALTGLTNSLSAELAPAFTSALTSATAFISSVSKDTDALADAFETVKDAGLVLAAVVTGKVVASVGKASAAFIADAVAAGRASVGVNAYGAALTRTTVAVRVATVATGALRGALAFLGGPLGIAVAAATAILLFKDSNEKAEVATGDFLAKVKELTSEVDTLSKKQLSALSVNISRQIELADSKIDEFRQSIAQLNSDIDNGVLASKSYFLGEIRLPLNKEEVKKTNDKIILQEAELEKIEKAKTDLVKKQLNLKNQIANPTTKKPEKNRGDKGTDCFTKLLSSLKQEIALYDESSQAAKLSYKLKEGLLGTFSEKQKAAIQDQINALAALEEAYKKKKEQKEKTQEFNNLVASLRSEEEALKDSYDTNLQTILQYEKATALQKNELKEKLDKEYAARRREIEQNNNGSRAADSDAYWKRYTDSLYKSTHDFDELSRQALENFSSGMGDTFEQMIFDSESFSDSFSTMMEGVARSAVNSIGQIITQLLILKAVQAGSSFFGLGTTEAAAGAKAGAGAVAGSCLIPVAAHDSGGLIPAGEVGLVGELGPELIAGPATVTSRRTTADKINNKSSNKAAQVTFSPVLNITANDKTQAEDISQSVNTTLRSLFSEFIADQQRSGGMLNRYDQI